MASSSVVAGLGFLLLLSTAWNVESLQNGFYPNTCPKAQAAIQNIVRAAVKSNKRIGAGLLRLFFHDCWVQGCDASILIDGNNVEKNAAPNLSLHDLQVIDQAKAAVEALCTKTVSCADIVAMAASTSLTALGGPTVDLRWGRFDGFVSSEAQALQQLPSQTSSLKQLLSNFKGKGLSQTDLVALSGAHSAGKAHCSSFQGRLFGFNKTFNTDPSLKPSFANSLKKQCPIGVNSNVLVNNDVISPTVFDNGYYRDVASGRGLFQSDAALLTSTQTKNLVNFYAGNNGAFFNQFAQSLIKMGNIGIKTRKNGNIRRNCRSFA